MLQKLELFALSRTKSCDGNSVGHFCKRSVTNRANSWLLQRKVIHQASLKVQRGPFPESQV